MLKKGDIKKEKVNLRPVLIKWEDIEESHTAWQTPDEGIKWGAKHKCIVHQLAFIVEDNDRYLLVTNQHMTDTEGDIAIGGVTRIPKGCIISIKRLKLNG